MKPVPGSGELVFAVKIGGTRQSVATSIPMKLLKLSGPGPLLLLALIFGVSASMAADATPVQTAVRAVLAEQVKDWNAGNIERFMRGYQPSPTTRFASGGHITLGWQAVLERYQRTYSDKAAMGHLTFSEIDVTVLADDAALVFGRWHLKRDQDEPSGLFTLLFRKTDAGWKIVHDHTSAAEKK
jgi:ketosteroid isomerase-like protein